MPDCTHPPESLTWKNKGPGGTILLIDGLLHATCDLCGGDVYREATFEVTQYLPGGVRARD